MYASFVHCSSHSLLMILCNKKVHHISVGYLTHDNIQLYQKSIVNSRIKIIIGYSFFNICLREFVQIDILYCQTTGRPVQSLHLVVGAVAASARYLDFGGPDPVQRLADTMSAPRSFISCIADVILKEILVDSPSPEGVSQPKKRKITHVSTQTKLIKRRFLK